MTHKPADPRLRQLLHALQPDAPLPQRHLWLHDMLEWVRGTDGDVQQATGRVRQLLATVQDMPEWLPRWQLWWDRFITGIDVTPLLADFGFAPRTAFLSELTHRLGRKWLPVTPDTTDLSQLFHLLLPAGFDAQWIRALDPATTAQACQLLFGGPVAAPAAAAPAAPPGLSDWQQALVDSVICCTSHITAIGFANEIRVRMAHNANTIGAYHDLPARLDDLVRALHAGGLQAGPTLQAAQAFRDQLAACRQAASTVYEHLDQHGVSVGIVFMLRQLRERIQRVNELLDCLLSPQPAHSTARLIARMVKVGQERRSLRTLWRNSTHLTAAKVAERHAESGEHYITRNAREWRLMFARGLGGGAAIGLAVWFKFLITGMGLSIFWNGFAAGMNYAVIFVLIYLLHWTVATKQPALTAPAMAARLKDMNQPNAVDAFVDEVSHLIRSQIAAITGNILGVVPAVWLICLAVRHITGEGMLADAYAAKTLHSLSVAGPTLLFAALTGVLLFASSIIAGWVENWFVFHRLDSSIAWHPYFRRLLGAGRAARWGLWWRTHVSGLAANISLGLLLGLVPAFAQFFGMGLEVRHVTLAAGQIVAASCTLGWPALHEAGFWLAVVAVALVGPINLAVSFYLAFRTAMAAHNIQKLDRRRVHAALRYRMLHAPGSFLFPPARTPATTMPPAPPRSSAGDEPPDTGTP